MIVELTMLTDPNIYIPASINYPINQAYPIVVPKRDDENHGGKSTGLPIG